MHSLVVFAVQDWVSHWLTPIWLLGVGMLAGLLGLLVLGLVAWLISRIPGIGTLADRTGGSDASVLGRVVVRPLSVLVSRRTVAEVPVMVREGALWPLFIIAASLAGFGVVGAVFVQEPVELLSSLTRLPYAGTTTSTFHIPVSEPDDPENPFAEPVAYHQPVPLNADEVRSVTFLSDQSLSISMRPFQEVAPGQTLEAIPGEPATWHRTMHSEDPLIPEDFDGFYMRNLGGEAAQVQLTVVTAPPHPQVATIPMTAALVMVVFLLYIWQRAAAPRLSAIALSTYKSEIAQPLFPLLILLGLFLLWLFIWIPYNTFGEDIKMLKDSGLVVIMLLGILLAVWAASNSVADEIEGKTALTVLSKPVGRRSFILGKFLGIVWTVAVLFAVLGLMLLIVVAYKPIHEARETATQDLTWQLTHMEMVYTVPGLALAFMETIVLAAISVAISTRLPLLANFTICLAIYLLGHLTPLIVQSSMGQFVFVQFFGQLIATILPNLDHFRIEAAVAAGLPVPLIYLGISLLYCATYTVIAMLLALVLFEDRDLA